MFRRKESRSSQVNKISRFFNDAIHFIESHLCNKKANKFSEESKVKKFNSSKNKFTFEEAEQDSVREKFEVIGIKLNLHKNGTLYLKELVLLISLV